MCFFSVIIFEGKFISQVNSCLADCYNHKGKKIICYDAQFNMVTCHPLQRSLETLAQNLFQRKPIRALVNSCILCTNLRDDGVFSLGTGTLTVERPTIVVFSRTIF